ncbi:MAG: NAD(P)/FAD-dependent oxidoreductase [Lawsonibacter sp.]|jgi:thioredoxin reductase (NADPH)
MYDIIVVGGGPAGLTAGLYAARAGKDVLILEGESTGGQINYSPLVDNYPGLPGVSGSQFAQTLTQQAQEHGAHIRAEAVTFLRTQNGVLEVTTEKGRYTATALILATGVRHRKLGLEGEDALVGAGVSYCAVCDGAFYQGQPVAVVGGGDTALQEALFLSARCSKVTLIHRRSQLRGGEHLVRQLRERDNVEWKLDCKITGLLWDEAGLTGVCLAEGVEERKTELAVTGLFVAIGQEPRNEIFTNLIMTDDKGYFLVDEDCATSLPGVFAAGDCRVKEVRQLATAVGDGAVAGLAASRYVDQHRD